MQPDFENDSRLIEWPDCADEGGSQPVDYETGRRQSDDGSLHPADFVIAVIAVAALVWVCVTWGAP